MKLKIFALGALLSLLIVVPLSAQNCQAGLPCRQVPWQFPPLPILLSPSPIPTTVATAAPAPTSQSGLIQATPTAVYCPTGYPTAATYRQKVMGFSPSGYWPMDELGGSLAGDASGAGLGGTYSGVTLNGNTFATGGAAPMFDGVNDYIGLPAQSLGGALSWTEGTITLWLEMDYSTEWPSSSERIILDFQKLDGFILITKSGALTLTAEVWRGAYDSFLNIEDIDTAPNTWHFVALSWDEQGFLFRVDDTTITESSGGAWGRNLSAARVGADALFGDHAFNGSLAHVAVFNRAMNESDLDALALSDTTGPTDPNGCVTAPTAQAPFDIDAINGIIDSAVAVQTPVGNLSTAPVYDLYGNSLNFFSILLGLRDVDIGPFTPLVVALFAGFFLHVTVFIIEKGAPIFAVVIGVIRKLIQVILDFLPG